MSKRGKAPNEAQGTPSPSSLLVEYFSASRRAG